MRVAAVELRDHPGLGDLSVDFRDLSGRAARHVVLAGENGCGKTAILEAIFEALAPTRFLQHSPRRLEKGRYKISIELDVPGSFANVHPALQHDPATRVAWEEVIISFGEDEPNSWPLHSYTFSNDSGRVSLGRVSSDTVFIDPLRVFYSEASLAFDVSPIINITNSAGGPLETGVVEAIYPVRSGTGLSQQIAQLLVDLKAADDAEAGRWMVANDGRPPDEVRNRRISAFSSAYSRLVPHKRFAGTRLVNGEYQVLFEDGPRQTSLRDLSTGEKQVIFRGAFLLRSAEKLPGAIVLIDEPELSLHPSWQSGVLPFYDSIVTEEETRTSQIIVATHSPFVVHGSPAAKHVVLKRSPTARIVVEDNPSYPGVTTSDVAIAAFDVAELLAGRGPTLTLLVEGPTDSRLLELAWAALRPNRLMPFRIIPAGGARALQQMLGSEPEKPGPLLEAASAIGFSSVLGIFDFDGEGYARWNGAVKESHAERMENDRSACAWRKRRGANVWVALLPVPSFRRAYAGMTEGLKGNSKLTIELLFPDPFVASMLQSVPAAGVAGATYLRASETQKDRIATAAADFPAGAFASFEPIFRLAESIV